MNAKHSTVAIALGAFLCIALGASMTYWMTHKPAPAPTPSQNQPDAARKADAGSDFLPVTFTTLASYYYELPSADASGKVTPSPNRIPAPIRFFDGKKVAVTGFMVPIDLKNGKSTQFLLAQNQICCHWGAMPRMNEWISVRMNPGKSARVIQDQPVTVFGTLQVGELIEGGEVLSVYRLDAEDTAGPLDL